MIIAPTITTPEIALEADIKGVCKVGGTLVIISYPIKSAKTNIIISDTNSNLFLYSAFTILINHHRINDFIIKI